MIPLKPKKKKRKIEFSKLITICSILLFCIVLYKSFQYDFTSYMDTTFLVTAITVTGGICGTCIIWMLKKSQSENIIKIRMGMYKDVKEIELDFNEKMFELKKKYELTDSDVYDIQNKGNIDDFSNEVLSETNSEMIERTSEADANIEMQNYY